jgi:hypothetical protein
MITVIIINHKNIIYMYIHINVPIFSIFVTITYCVPSDSVWELL